VFVGGGKVAPWLLVLPLKGVTINLCWCSRMPLVLLTPPFWDASKRERIDQTRGRKKKFFFGLTWAGGEKKKEKPRHMINIRF